MRGAQEISHHASKVALLYNPISHPASAPSDLDPSAPLVSLHEKNFYFFPLALQASHTFLVLLSPGLLARTLGPFPKSHPPQEVTWHNHWCLWERPHQKANFNQFIRCLSLSTCKKARLEKRLLFTGGHSSQDQILFVKMIKHIGFYVYHRSC